MSVFYTSVIQYGNNILYRGYENGRAVKLKVPFRPTLYVKSKGKSSTKSLYGDYVEQVKFGDINDAKEFLDRYKDVDNFNIYGMRQFQYQYIAEQFPTDIEFDMSAMRIWSMDIETASDMSMADPNNPTEPILLISVMDKSSGKVKVWGWKDYIGDGDFEYHQSDNEASMLKTFIQCWQEEYPDIVTGWFIDGFDIPYIINRTEKILGNDWVKKLSPWGLVRSNEIVIMKKPRVQWDIVGVNIVDYLDLYKKFTYSSQESYSLDFIAGNELGETKHKIEGSFQNAYTNHWDDFVRYNVQDTKLVAKLDDKLKFLELICTIAYLAKCQIRDVFGPVKTWDVFIYNYLKAKGIVVPPTERKSAGDFEGAWVKEPEPGMYGWVVSFDFSSLYPSILRQWNMSPDTIVDVDPTINVDSYIDRIDPFDTDYTVAANGARFRKDIHGIIPEVVKVVIDGRKIAKKEMIKLEQEKGPAGKIASLNAKQMAFKILANALYGALSNPGFRYYDLRIAEAVTMTGQASDRHVERTLNRYMNNLLKTTDFDYVIAGDTDSVYLNVNPLVEKLFPQGADTEQLVNLIDRICSTKIQEQITASIKQMYDVGNCYEPIMDMKREAIASKAIWTAKKRYAMMIHNSEGVDYKPYKLKIMGMDIVKSSTPMMIRKKLKEALTVIFEKDQVALYRYISDLKEHFMQSDPSLIAFPRSVNDLDKYADKNTVYTKHCPIAVRGALLYNKYVTDKGKIRSGDKVKFIYLRMPNPIREDVIAFPSHESFPVELDLTEYIDWDKMWDNVFISPMKGITDAIGWKTEEVSSLENFFA